MATHTMIWSIQLCTLWWTVTHAEYYRSRSYSKFLLIFTIRASKLTSYLSIKASDPSPDHLCACVCARARVFVCISGCVHSPSRRVPEQRSSTASEPAAGRSSASGRPEPPSRRAHSCRVPADNWVSSLTHWARDGRAPLSGSARFGSVRFGSVQFGSAQFTGGPYSLVLSGQRNLLRDGEADSPRGSSPQHPAPHFRGITSK